MHYQKQISKFLFKTILLNDLKNLFHNNLIGMRANNLIYTNKRYLKLYIIINIVSYNSNKSDEITQGPHIKQKINIALGLIHFLH